MEKIRKTVTNRQIFYILFLTISTYTTIDLPKFMAEYTGRTSWIIIFIVALLFIVPAIIITKLNNMYQGKAMYDYSENIVGKFFSKSICLYYLLYFLIIGVFLKLKLVGLMRNNFLPDTPNIAILISGIALFGYVAYKGITNIARMFEIIGAIFLVITIMLCIFMVTQGMKENVQPFIDYIETKNILQSIKCLVSSFGGIEILLIIPFARINKKASKVVFLSIIFIGLFYILIVESTIMILGINNTIALNDSFIEAIKIVEVPVIERTDLSYLTFGLTSLFAGMIIVFTGVLEFTCKIFYGVKRQILAIVIFTIFLIMCIFALKINNMNDFFNSFSLYIILVSIILIPSLLFIIANIKKRLNKNKQTQGE